MLRFPSSDQKKKKIFGDYRGLAEKHMKGIGGAEPAPSHLSASPSMQSGSPHGSEGLQTFLIIGCCVKLTVETTEPF